MISLWIILTILASCALTAGATAYFMHRHTHAKMTSSLAEMEARMTRVIQASAVAAHHSAGTVRATAAGGGAGAASVAPAAAGDAVGATVAAAAEETGLDGDAEEEVYVPTHRYATECQSAKQRALDMIESAGWEPLHEEDGVVIVRKTVPGSDLQCVKGTGVIDAPPAAILEVVRDITRKGEYDEMLDTARIVEHLDEYTCLNYSSFKRVWPTTARDFVTLQVEEVDPTDGSIVMSFFSVEDPSCPELSSHVRASVLIGAWVLRAVPGNPRATQATYAAQVDLAGSLPTRIVNKATSKAPMCIAGLRPILRAMPNLDSYVWVPPAAAPAPAATAASSVSSIDVFSSDEEDMMDVDDTLATTAATTTTTATASPDAVPVSLSDELLQCQHTAKQATSEVLRQARLLNTVSVDNPEATLRMLPTNRLPWSYEGQKKGVVIFRRSMEDSPIHAFLGMGRIKHSPERVFEAVTNLAVRHEYDRMLHKYEVLAQIDHSSRVVLLHHKTRKCMMEHSRDFCVSMYHTVDAETGWYVVAGRSVAYSGCPERAGIKRGVVLESGWLVRPDPGNPRFSLVTYLAQIDVGGAPSSVINHVAVRQPLCIRYLADYLDKLV